MANTPQSMSSLSRKSSPGDDGQEAVGTIWSSETQGPLMHWILFELFSKYEASELHRKLDGLIFRVLTLPSASVSPSDRDAIVLLRKEPGQSQYLLCVGREEPWQSVWPEDRIMTAVQSAGLATARHLGTTVARKGVVGSDLPVGELLSEGKLWRKAQVEGRV